MHLTPREQEILQRVCLGQSNKAIATDLRISEQAVKAHVSRLLAKFSVHNRAGLVAAATAHRGRPHVADADLGAALMRGRRLFDEQQRLVQRAYGQLHELNRIQRAMAGQARRAG